MGSDIFFLPSFLLSIFCFWIVYKKLIERGGGTESIFPLFKQIIGLKSSQSLKDR